MSEIRPATQRSDTARVQQERPVKTEQKVKDTSPQKAETQRAVVRHDANTHQSNQPKGGNVDITV